MNDLLDTDLPDLPAVRELLARATADLEPPTGLDIAARYRGRVLRVRRRMLAAGVGVAAAAAVAVVAVPLAGGNDTAQVATQPSATASPTAGGSPSPFIDRPGWWDRPATSMKQVLAGLLPAGVRIVSAQTTEPRGERAPGQPAARAGELTGVLTGPTGVGAFEIQLTQLPDGDWGQATRAAADAAAAATSAASPRVLDTDRLDDAGLSALAQVAVTDFSCPAELSESVDSAWCENILDHASGSVLGRTLETHDHGVTTRSVRVHVGAGELYLAVANATDRKWRGPATATEPPLTTQQLRTIAGDGSWAAWVATP